MSERLDRLESVPDSYNKRVAKSQPEIFKTVMGLIDSLDRKDGQILITESNLTKVNQIINDLKGTLSESKYFKSTISFIKEFNEQARLIDLDFAALNIEPNDVNVAVLQTAKNEAIQALLSESALTQEYYRPLQKILNNSISNGASYADTVDAIRSITVGDTERLGLLHRYAGQIASDAFATSDRNYSHSIAEENGVEWYRYQGGLIADSRDFCTQRNGKFYHKKEIEDWGDLTWQGQIRGTNSSNIFSNLGGHNCKHSLVAVSIVSVPKSVIKRNIASGNFIPSDFERESLGL